MAESTEDRRKRLKALSSQSAAAEEAGDSGAAASAGALDNPFAEKGGAALSSGPFNFYRSEPCSLPGLLPQA